MSDLSPNTFTSQGSPQRMMMMWMKSGMMKMKMTSSALIAMRTHMAIAKSAIVVRAVAVATYGMLATLISRPRFN
jgi:hypothetical protein